MAPKYLKMSNHLPGCLAIADPVTGICCPSPHRHNCGVPVVNRLNGSHQSCSVSVGLRRKEEGEIEFLDYFVEENFRNPPHS